MSVPPLAPNTDIACPICAKVYLTANHALSLAVIVVGAVVIVAGAVVVVVAAVAVSVIQQDRWELAVFAVPTQECAVVCHSGMSCDKELAVLQFPPKSVRLFAILGCRCVSRILIILATVRPYRVPSLRWQ